VELPFPALVRDLLTLAANKPHGQSMDGYVFWAERKPDKPMEQAIFNRSLRKALVQTGMSETSPGYGTTLKAVRCSVLSFG
jgi:hypothetical protein